MLVYLSHPLPIPQKFIPWLFCWSHFTFLCYSLTFYVYCLVRLANLSGNRSGPDYQPSSASDSSLQEQITFGFDHILFPLFYFLSCVVPFNHHVCNSTNYTCTHNRLHIDPSKHQSVNIRQLLILSTYDIAVSGTVSGIVYLQYLISSVRWSLPFIWV